MSTVLSVWKITVGILFTFLFNSQIDVLDDSETRCREVIGSDPVSTICCLTTEGVLTRTAADTNTRSTPAKIPSKVHRLHLAQYTTRTKCFNWNRSVRNSHVNCIPEDNGAFIRRSVDTCWLCPEMTTMLRFTLHLLSLSLCNALTLNAAATGLWTNESLGFISIYTADLRKPNAYIYFTF